MVRVESFEETRDENDLWVKDNNDDPVYRFCYLSFNFLHGKHSGRRGLEWLRDWNGRQTVLLDGDTYWDTIDVTDFVRAEYSGDRSLSVLLNATQGAKESPKARVRWFGTNSSTPGNRVAFYPVLLIEYEVSPK